MHGSSQQVHEQYFKFYVHTKSLEDRKAMNWTDFKKYYKSLAQWKILSVDYEEVPESEVVRATFRCLLIQDAESDRPKPRGMEDDINKDLHDNYEDKQKKADKKLIEESNSQFEQLKDPKKIKYVGVEPISDETTLNLYVFLWLLLI